MTYFKLLHPTQIIYFDDCTVSLQAEVLSLHAHPKKASVESPSLSSLQPLLQCLSLCPQVPQDGAMRLSSPARVVTRYSARATGGVHCSRVCPGST